MTGGRPPDAGGVPGAGRASGEEPPPEAGLPDPRHIVVEPLEGAVRGFVVGMAGLLGAVLPTLLDAIGGEGGVSLPVLAVGTALLALIVGWVVLQALGRARQREVYWEATAEQLTVHMDNIGPLEWHRLRAVEPVRARFGWLTGSPVTAVKVYPWLPMEVRRRMKPDPDVRYLVRRPVMTGDDRFIRLPLWDTKMREHGEEIALRLQEWHAGYRR